MFMTKIDRTTSLTTKSKNAFSLNLTLHFPIYASADSSSLKGKIRFCLMISPASFGSDVSRFNWNQSCCLHYLVPQTKSEVEDLSHKFEDTDKTQL